MSLYPFLAGIVSSLLSTLVLIVAHLQLTAISVFSRTLFRLAERETTGGLRALFGGGYVFGHN